MRAPPPIQSVPTSRVRTILSHPYTVAAFCQSDSAFPMKILRLAHELHAEGVVHSRLVKEYLPRAALPWAFGDV